MKDLFMKINVKYMCVIAIECPPFPQVQNADITGNGTEYNSTIHYSCHSGFVSASTDILRQENGHVTNVISCEQNSSWSVSSLSCECKYCADIALINMS